MDSGGALRTASGLSICKRLSPLLPYQNINASQTVDSASRGSGLLGFPLLSFLPVGPGCPVFALGPDWWARSVGRSLGTAPRHRPASDTAILTSGVCWRVLFASPRGTNSSSESDLTHATECGARVSATDVISFAVPRNHLSRLVSSETTNVVSLIMAGAVACVMRHRPTSARIDGGR
jgi:hypothetical protein